MLLQSHEHTKLESHARLCCFLGYGTEHKGFRCWDLVVNLVKLATFMCVTQVQYSTESGRRT